MKAFALLLSPTRRLAEIRRVPQILMLLLFYLREIRSGASPNNNSPLPLSHEPHPAIGGIPARAANFNASTIPLARDSLRRLAEY